MQQRIFWYARIANTRDPPQMRVLPEDKFSEFVNTILAPLFRPAAAGADGGAASDGGYDSEPNGDGDDADSVGVEEADDHFNPVVAPDCMSP